MKYALNNKFNWQLFYRYWHAVNKTWISEVQLRLPRARSPLCLVFSSKIFCKWVFYFIKKKPFFLKPIVLEKKLYQSSSSGVVVITTAQRSSIKSELRFCTGSNPALGVSEICDGENLWQWSRLEIRRKRLSSVNHSAKTIHHHNPWRPVTPKSNPSYKCNLSLPTNVISPANLLYDYKHTKSEQAWC